MSGFWTTLWRYLVDTCSRTVNHDVSYEAPSGVAAVPVSDDMLMEIFSRMPAESVHQCMLAYEDWNALLSTPYFNHNLFLPRASPTIIVQRGSLVDDQLFYIEDDHRGGLKSKQISAAIPGLYEKSNVYFPLINVTTRVRFSCYGLIFFNLPYPKKVIISVVNLITRRWLCLHFDSNVKGNICGVFFHPTAREFRVLWVSLWRTSSKKPYVEFKMLRPRSEEHPQLCWNALSKLQSRPITDEPPVNLHDCLHWMCYEYGSVWFQHIMVFSTVKEEFKLMPSISSEEPSQDKRKRRHLLDLDGYLSLWELTDVLNIWTVEDYNYESWSWTKRYSIEVKLLHKRVKVDEVSVVGFQNGALVIHWIGKGIFVYHLQHRTTKRFIFNKLRGNGCFTIPFLHTNSLLSMDGFTRDEYKNRPFVM